MRTVRWVPLVALLGCGAPAAPAVPPGVETAPRATADEVLGPPPRDLVRQVDACRDGGSLPMACDRGCGEACRRFGVELLGSDDPRESAAGHDYLDRGCRLDDGPACGVLGAIAFRRDGSGVDRLSRACELGQASGCAVAGLAREDLSMVARACELGSGPGCYFEGIMRLAQEDLTGARRALSASCERGFEHGCAFEGLLGAIDDPGRGMVGGGMVGGGMVEMLEALHAGCRAGEPSLCELLEALDR